MAYVSPSLVTQFQDQIDQQLSSDGLGPMYTGDLKKQLDSFQGAAAVLRFDGGSLELKAEATMDMSSAAQPAPAPVADLPASTIFAAGMGFKPGSVATPLQDYWNQLMQSDPTYDSDMRAIQEQTGLTLPDDLITLFGNGYAFAVDSSFDPSVFSSPSMPDGNRLPMGIRFVGNADAIAGVLHKVSDLASSAGLPLAVEKGDGAAAISFSSEYAKKLAGSGGLGTSPSYQAAVQSPSDPDQVMYVDLGAVRDWVKQLDAGDPSLSGILDNMAPLDAVGMASYRDGQDTYVDMRLTTH